MHMIKRNQQYTLYVNNLVFIGTDCGQIHRVTAKNIKASFLVFISKLYKVNNVLLNIVR